MVLASGVLTFGHGYTVWKDVLVGEIGFASPPMVYEILRQHAGGGLTGTAPVGAGEGSRDTTPGGRRRG